MGAAAKPKARKTPPNTPMRPGKNGGALKTGNPGNAGGGRRPAWVEEWADGVLSDPETRKQVASIMGGKKNPKAFAAMWKALSERAFGKPTESIEVSGAVGLTIQVVHE
jgi:hypothetical protein